LIAADHRNLKIIMPLRHIEEIRRGHECRNAGNAAAGQSLTRSSGELPIRSIITRRWQPESTGFVQNRLFGSRFH
jgi:hypothetical protein